MVTRYISIAVLIAALAGCAPLKNITTNAPAPLPAPIPSSPSIPQPIPTPPEAAVHIAVAYPAPDQLRPIVDSNFIFGSVGNGNASLSINGHAVPLAKNGAFLAFLPMPADGEYHLIARRGNDFDSTTVSYSAKENKSNDSSENQQKSEKQAKIFHPEFAVISKGSDTLQTGNDVAPGALTPDGNREWFFPRGATLRLIEHEGKYYKAELDKKTFAWIADSNFDLNSKPHRSNFDKLEIHPAEAYVDFDFPCNFNPFQITPEGNSIRVHIYGEAMPKSFKTIIHDPLVHSVCYDSISVGVDVTVQLNQPVWGYKAFYMKDGALDVRIRRPPVIYKDNPLEGIRIMIDPGHPPGGAIGPTELTEREANLALAIRVRDMLAARGATVLMTHADLHGIVSDENQVEELDTRAALAVRDNVDLMVSIHNNAFPDGTNPFFNYGTSTFYFHPFSAQLAYYLDKEIAAVTGIPNLGSMKKSLAICRPAWMPCALTESLYLMFPDQESALRDPAFLDKLAAAHLRGIEDFLRDRGGE